MLAAAAHTPEVITPAYREMQSRLHADNPNYGIASLEFAPIVATIIEHFGIDDLLDYGAGKGRLAQGLRQHCKRVLRYHPYDPAIDAWSARPQGREFVTCIDVLEHIEPECLDAVLDELQRCTLRMGFFTVHTGKALKTLSDGRNAHLIQAPPSWWLPKLMARFELLKFVRDKAGFWVLVEPLREGAR
jgi:hypothetical protein